MIDDRKKKNVLEWYVMKCRKSADIAAEIDAYIADQNVRELDRIDNYFIPATVLQRKTSSMPSSPDGITEEERVRSDAAVRSNGIRNTLRSFVFLLVRPSGLTALESQRWNHADKRIYHYRNYNGKEVTASQKMMDRFIDACNEYGSKLEICTVRRKIEKGITVTVREGAFAGLEAEVVDIQYKAEGIRFTIAVKLFAKGNYAYVHDRREEDVIVSEKDSYVFNADFIDRMESSLLTILKRRIKHKESKQEKEDNDEQVRQYYRLHSASIGDNDLAVKFDSLMSICASMHKGSTARTKYLRILKNRIKDVRQNRIEVKKPQTCLAYLLSALYFCTKDAEYRTELKEIVNEHLSADDIMRRYVAILRLL